MGRDVYFFAPQWRQAVYVHLYVILVSSVVIFSLFASVLGCNDIQCTVSHMVGRSKVTNLDIGMSLVYLKMMILREAFILSRIHTQWSHNIMTW